MADIEIRREHNMSKDEACAIVDGIADKLCRELGLTRRQTGDEVFVTRPGVQGKLAVSDAHVVVTVELGFVMKTMKPTLAQGINRKLDQYLN